MCKKTVVVALCAIGISTGTTLASLTPIGTYTIKFERTGWSEERTISVQPFPTAEAFYSVGGKDVNVYLEEVAQPEPDMYAFTWYVNAPAVLDDPTSNTLLGGTGPLTITVSDMTFAETPYVTFEPLVTHLYYVGYDGSYYQVKDLPGDEPVYPGSTQMQRSPVMPVGPAEPDYNPADPYYGTPYETAGVDVSFVLPEMYVPSDVGGTVWELSFGAGFTAYIVPEPAVAMLLASGALWVLGFRRRQA